MTLDVSFYVRKDVTRIARELLGKRLCTKTGRAITSGIIVETEAYSDIERGCHAYKGMTERNKVMFEDGGIAYVYLCYGMHQMFNVVTNTKGKADAVLIRALEPLEGIDEMLRRTGKPRPTGMTSGPGKLTRALNIGRAHNGVPLNSSNLWIDEGIVVRPRQIEASTRIGIDYAGEDAKRLWRFSIRGNSWVSK